MSEERKMVKREIVEMETGRNRNVLRNNALSLLKQIEFLSEIYKLISSPNPLASIPCFTPNYLSVIYDQFPLVLIRTVLQSGQATVIYDPPPLVLHLKINFSSFMLWNSRNN